MCVFCLKHLAGVNSMYHILAQSSSSDSDDDTHSAPPFFVDWCRIKKHNPEAYDSLFEYVSELDL
jgi:hypothetical protein